MKRSALSILTALLPASVLVGGMAHAGVAIITPMPYGPDASTIVTMAEGTLAEAGVPLEAPALPAAPDAETVLITVNDTIAAAGFPVDVPLEAPALPAAPQVDSLLTTVSDTIAGAGLSVPGI